MASGTIQSINKSFIKTSNATIVAGGTGTFSASDITTRISNDIAIIVGTINFTMTTVNADWLTINLNNSVYFRGSNFGLIVYTSVNVMQNSMCYIACNNNTSEIRFFLRGSTMRGNALTVNQENRVDIFIPAYVSF